MHEHMATTRHEGEFWKVNLMLFTESWLTVDTFVELDGSQERRKAIEQGWLGEGHHCQGAALQ